MRVVLIGWIAFVLCLWAYTKIDQATCVGKIVGPSEHWGWGDLAVDYTPTMCVKRSWE